MNDVINAQDQCKIISDGKSKGYPVYCFRKFPQVDFYVPRTKRQLRDDPRRGQVDHSAPGHVSNQGTAERSERATMEISLRVIPIILTLVIPDFKSSDGDERLWGLNGSLGVGAGARGRSDLDLVHSGIVL